MGRQSGAAKLTRTGSLVRPGSGRPASGTSRWPQTGQDAFGSREQVDKRISVLIVPPRGRTGGKRWRFPRVQTRLLTMPGLLSRLGLVGLVATACARPFSQRSIVLPISAQALSLLGDTLWSLPINPEEGPALVEQLNKARNRATSSPLDVNAALVVARRTADLGRLRESVELYTKADE